MYWGLEMTGCMELLTPHIRTNLAQGALPCRTAQPSERTFQPFAAKGKNSGTRAQRSEHAHVCTTPRNPGPHCFTRFLMIFRGLAWVWIFGRLGFRVGRATPQSGALDLVLQVLLISHCWFAGNRGIGGAEEDQEEQYGPAFISS